MKKIIILVAIGMLSITSCTSWKSYYGKYKSDIDITYHNICFEDQSLLITKITRNGRIRYSAYGVGITDIINNAVNECKSVPSSNIIMQTKKENRSKYRIKKPIIRYYVMFVDGIRIPIINIEEKYYLEDNGADITDIISLAISKLKVRLGESSLSDIIKVYFDYQIKIRHHYNGSYNRIHKKNKCYYNPPIKPMKKSKKFKKF